MASNISSSGTFVVTNMKPASGEQVDALWGQNIGDNTGYLRAQEMPIFQGGNGTNGTSNTSQPNASLSLSYPLYIMRIKGHNTLYGTYTDTITCTDADSPDITYTHGPILYGDLGTHTAHRANGTHSNLVGALSTGSTFGFSIDLSSYMSEGAWGTLVLNTYGTKADSGLSETFALGLGLFRGYTTWV